MQLRLVSSTKRALRPSPLCLLPLLAACSSANGSAALPPEDEAALRTLSDRFVAGWLANDREAVMRVMAPEAVFIPHDGVKPKIGYKAIDAFWFPDGKPAGTVTAMSHVITDVSGNSNRGTAYGRSDLTWQDNKQRYHWIGNFLISAKKEKGRWLVTHLVSSDEPPTISDLEMPKPASGE